MPITLARIRRYPIKSCRGEDLDSAVVEPWGLRGDRRWMLVDQDDVVVTAREVHRMLLVRPELVALDEMTVPDGGGASRGLSSGAGLSSGGGLSSGAGLSSGGVRLTAPGMPELVVAAPASPTGNVRIWRSTVAAASGGPDADAWFSEVMQQSVRLVYLDDPTRRATNPEFSKPGDVVSFADGYPVLLASESSLDLLNDWIAQGSRPNEGPIDMRRFRPSLVVRGAEPFVEDGWTRIRIGEATFRVVKGCDRCVLTTLDPETGEKQMEPITTLARHRRWDGKTWFAANLVPDSPGAEIHVGDEVEILDERDASDGPIRPAA